MKKIIAIALCAIISVCPLASSMPQSAAIQPALGEESAALPIALEDINEYLDKNLTIIEHPEGYTTVTLAPSAAYAAMHQNAAAKSAVSSVQSVSVAPAMAGAQPDWRYTTNQKHAPLPLTEKYQYTLLSDELKKCYRAIDTAVRNLEASADFDLKMSENRNYYVYYHYMFDNPELFYLCNTVSICNNGDGTSSLEFFYAASRDFYNLHTQPTEELKQAIRTKKAVFDAKVNEIISTIPANAPEVVKESLIYSKILLNSYYNLSAQWNGINEDNWNAYGILCNGYGVCESYAEAFQTLCNAVGINCTGVVGVAGGGHKWNTVKIDGEWYQTDITFDDPLGGDPTDALNYYFNLTTQEMLEKNHTWEGSDYPPMNCTATKWGHDNFIATYGPEINGTLHYFTADCDTTCENCSYSRYVYEDNHNYSDAYDATCNTCGFRRNMGWIYEEDNWYYYIDGERVTNKWVKDSKGWCYLLNNGTLATDGFYTDYTGKYFWVDANGHCAMNGWAYVYGGWVFADQNGYLLTDKWQLWKGKWYHFDSSGWMDSNCWTRDSAGEVYLGTDGAMVTNRWIEQGYNEWYFVNANGYKVTNKWMKDSKGWVYLGADGMMATNKWVRDSVGWCYVGYDGYCVTDKWKADSTGKECYLDANGRMATSQWLFDDFYWVSDKVYFFDCWFYVDANGYKVTGTKTIGNEKHVFNSYGVWLREI